MASRTERVAFAYPLRRPERGLLHRVLSEHLATFLERHAADPDRPGLPPFVQRELSRYLGCGLFATGFARVHCPTCSKDLLVAFSCKGRGFCPSCGGRRMAETAAHLTDNVFPDVPVRQWVVTFPWRVRFLLARDPALLRTVRSAALRILLSAYRHRCGFRARHSAHSGAVCMVQRFGSALNLNVHLHALVLDGVYTSTPDSAPQWHAAPSLTDKDVSQLCKRIRNRVLRILEQRGLLEEPDTDEPATQLCLIAAASVQGKSALGPDREAAVARLGRTNASSTERPRHTAPLCASIDGFSLHAAVRIPAGESNRARLEHLCRYIARPALSTERLSLTRQGNILLTLRRPWSDGTSRFVFEPLAFLERLAALIPRPRAHLLTYHGALAPASTIRSRIVPRPPERPLRGKGLAADACDPRYSWAELMKRVFGHDVLRCHHCGNRRQIIALITEASVIRRILQHLGLPTELPPLEPARPPPGFEFAC